jgi:hypothetical protein
LFLQNSLDFSFQCAIFAKQTELLLTLKSNIMVLFSVIRVVLFYIGCIIVSSWVLKKWLNRIADKEGLENRFTMSKILFHTTMYFGTMVICFAIIAIVMHFYMGIPLKW